MKTICFSLFLIMCSLCTCLTAQNLGQDIRTVKVHLRELALSFSDHQDTELEKIVASMDLKTGLFNDLDYKNQTPSEWQPGEHWRRLSSMAISYQSKASNYFQDKILLRAIIRGVESWTQHSFRAMNEWWNLIGVPSEMGLVFILMEQELGQELIFKNIPAMNLAVCPDKYNYHGPATGQNLLWETLNHIYSSVLTKDAEGIRRASNASAAEMIVTEKEGIQPDFSFHQHGAQSYAFGYGKAFSLTAAQIIYALNGTSFAIPQKNINIISRYILDGQQWCSYKQMLEYTAMGREIARPEGKTGSIVKASLLMAQTDLDRKKEYLDFVSQLRGEIRQNLLLGVKYFPRVDLLAQQGDGFFFSVKGASNRIVCTETGNNENLKGYHLGNGTMFIARSGDEYENIFPLWNWKRIPGCISEQNDAPLPQYDWTKGAQGTTSFVYGMSDGDNGLFTYDYSRDGIVAKRSWFCLNNRIVMLSSGITFDKYDEVYFSLNQCYRNTPVYVDGKPIAKDSLCSRIQSVWHDSIGYYFPEPEQVVVTDKEQSGSWKDINQSQSPKIYAAKVFTLSCNWGRKRQNSSSACIIVPNVSCDRSWTRECRDIEIRRNTHDMQEVYDKKNQTTYLVIFNSLSYQILGTQCELRSSTPVMCVIKRNGKEVIVTSCNEKGEVVRRFDGNQKTQINL